MVDALLVCVQNLDVEEVTNSVNSSCRQEQTSQKMPHTIHSYSQLVKTQFEIGTDFVILIVFNDIAS